MKTKNISRGTQVLALALSALMIAVAGFSAPSIRTRALTGRADEPQPQKPAPTITMDSPVTKAVEIPPLCPYPGQQPKVPSIFVDTFESGSAKWDFAATPGFTSKWSIATATIQSATHALFAPDSTPENDSWAAMHADVTLPPVVSSYLFFYHKFDFEYQSDTVGYDGGMVEYSTDHGATWKQDIDTMFIPDQNPGQGYTGTLATGYLNPLEGRKVFSGLSGGITATRFDLTPLAGQTVRFRWRVGTDHDNGSGQFPGWYVDDVSIFNCGMEVASVTRVDPSPTSASSVNFTVTFSEPVTGVDTDSTGGFDDFVLTTTGVSGASIASVAQVGVSPSAVYTVNVLTGSGNGSIRLDVRTSGHIVDTSGSPLGNPFTTGQVYAVLKNSNIFADVPPGYWAGDFINRLYLANITTGCAASPQRLYCPEGGVTRAQMAVFLLRAKHGGSYVPPAATGTVFNDVPKSYWAAAWVEEFAAEGITSGCGTKIYCPDAIVTRGQMAVFLLRGEHGSSYNPPAPTGVFTDVPITHSFAKWIEQLAAEGVTGGCSVTPKMYCPNGAVNRAQMAVFLVRAFKLP